MQLIQKHLRLIVLKLIEASDELIGYYKGLDKNKHFALLRLRDDLLALIENKTI